MASYLEADSLEDAKKKLESNEGVDWFEDDDDDYITSEEIMEPACETEEEEKEVEKMDFDEIEEEYDWDCIAYWQESGGFRKWDV